jgi:HSP20 family protein
MADSSTKVPGKIEKSPSTLQPWRPFESLRREVDRLFDDFSGGIWRSPFGRTAVEMEAQIVVPGRAHSRRKFL